MCVVYKKKRAKIKNCTYTAVSAWLRIGEPVLKGAKNWLLGGLGPTNVAKRKGDNEAGNFP